MAQSYTLDQVKNYLASRGVRLASGSENIDPNVLFLANQSQILEAGPYQRVAGGRIIDTRTGQEANQSGIQVETVQPYSTETGLRQPYSSGSGLIPHLNQYIQDQYAQGNILNPNVKITPQTLVQFLSQAENEINPYYSSQLKLARESLQRTLGYTTDEIRISEKEAERKYGRELRGIGESAAEKGFALSGLRQREEQDLAQTTQDTLEAQRRKLSFTAGGLGETFAQKYGSPSNIPTISSTPRVLGGEPAFQQDTRQAPLYSLSPSVYDSLIGSEEFARRSAVQQRASQLEEGQRRLLAV